uniref:Methyltransferase domain-containing protein n=1 Tax=Candidatus Kentrum eta TaxID=2126337 RepID=A0A450VDV7_9GAMM|nr:MAG: Methyltransferase domain-containing protein [Candidatus Kentron sp. H]VFK03296.1 MAG: Methyltransferase domain-containing protein [Candidatus Kentron sp. H]VFK05934.1 MAG: Methyltransferase domain-containing protein [Candidatus Kentron sp. H]
MSNYKNMAYYYDVIMTSGYYDYPNIARNILAYHKEGSILEIGCGTGLILEKLAKQKNIKEISGVDLTKEMIEIAAKRLENFNDVSLFHKNIIELCLDKKYDTSFSYGGVWYFVSDKESVFLVSHIPSHGDNEKGIKQLSECISSRGRLLLGIQGAHHDYEKTISNGMIYSQNIISRERGFTKNYYLSDKGETIMSQTVDYRTYSFDDAIELLANHGLKLQSTKGIKEDLFMEFKKS